MSTIGFRERGNTLVHSQHVDHGGVREVPYNFEANVPTTCDAGNLSLVAGTSNPQIFILSNLSDKVGRQQLSRYIPFIQSRHVLGIAFPVSHAESPRPQVLSTRMPGRCFSGILRSAFRPTPPGVQTESSPVCPRMCSLDRNDSAPVAA